MDRKGITRIVEGTLLLWLLVDWMMQPSAAEEINIMAKQFSQSIRIAIGPDGLARVAQERYVRGEIEADELDRLLQKIADEFGIIP